MKKRYLTIVLAMACFVGKAETVTVRYHIVNERQEPVSGAQRFGSAALNDIMIDVNVNTPSGVERVNGWPSMGSYTDRWCHSDMKDVSYFFNFKFYQKVVEKGELR